MYGLPDSAIVGSAKRISRMSRVKKYREYQEEEHWLEWLTRKLYQWSEQMDSWKKRKEIESKHRVRFVPRKK